MKTMRLCYLLIIFLVLFSTFSSAYQTFKIIKENTDDSQATIIVDLDSSDVQDDSTIIKIYPEEIKKEGFTELLSYSSFTSKQFNLLTIYSNDKRAVEISSQLEKESKVPVVIKNEKIDLRNKESGIEETQDKKDNMKGLSSITSGSLINLENETSSSPRIYTPIVIAIFVVAVLIILALVVKRK